MNSDLKLKKNILRELHREPSIDENKIGIITKNGVVTLSGYVNNFTQKRLVELVVRRVEGVKAIAEEIQVVTSDKSERSDAQIAEAVIEALKSNVEIPADKINVKVENGYVFLDGEVEWAFQKSEARDAISSVNGIQRIINRLVLKSNTKTKDVKFEILKVLEQSNRIDSSKISVEAIDNEVILKGSVHSWAEKEYAKRAAFNAEGKWTVRNELRVQ